IGDEQRGGGGAFTEIAEIRRYEDEGRDHRRAGDDGEQGRKETADPPFVEIQDGEASLADFLGDDASDQVTGYDEEDIDADETAAEGLAAGMEEHDGKHGDGAQAVNVWAILHAGRDILFAIPSPSRRLCVACLRLFCGFPVIFPRVAGGRSPG